MSTVATECPRCGGAGFTGRLVLCLDCGYQHEAVCARCLGYGYVDMVTQPPEGATR